MIEVDFKFSCPFCRQHIKAFSEYCGDEIECPSCREPFAVPNASYVFKNEPDLNREFVRYFEPEEIEHIARLHPDAAGIADGGTNMNCWEFFLTAYMIRVQIAPLEELLAQYGDEYPMVNKSLFKGNHTEEWRAFLKEMVNAFIGVFERSCETLSGGLWPAMYDDDLAAIESLSNGIAAECGVLSQLVESLMGNPCPSAAPFPELVRRLLGWAHHYCYQIHGVADRLDEQGQNPGPKFHYEYSLTPVDIYQFDSLLRQIDS